MDRILHTIKKVAFDFVWRPFMNILMLVLKTRKHNTIRLSTDTCNPISKVSENPQYVNVVNELLESEKKYIHYLQILNMIFLLPLKEATKNDKALISDVELRLIFSYIETILNLHSNFCKELETIVNENEMEGIGFVFLKNWEFFKMYSSYINGYNISLSTLANCKHQYPMFDKFIESAESNPMCTKLDLASLLIMPVQRLPRYILLLSDLLKNTPPTSQDFGNLQQSIDNLHSVMIHLNESKRVAENSYKVFEIQQSLIGKTQPIMEPHRVFHSEGNCVVRTTTTKTKSMHYFLFNDMILLVSPGKSLFNKDEWRIHFQLLLGDLSFAVLQYEKGLLIKSASLKIVLIVDTPQQLTELLDVLQTLKSKLPNITDMSPRLSTIKVFPKWILFTRQFLKGNYTIILLCTSVFLIIAIIWA